MILMLVCAFTILVILMQKPSSNSGLGTAMGGGMAESAFGVQTANVLSRATFWGITLFFILSFLIYLGYIAGTKPTEASMRSLPQIEGALSTELPAAAQAALSEEAAHKDLPEPEEL